MPSKSRSHTSRGISPTNGTSSTRRIVAGARDFFEHPRRKLLPPFACAGFGHHHKNGERLVRPDVEVFPLQHGVIATAEVESQRVRLHPEKNHRHPFRHAPAGVTMDAHNQRLADAIQADGRIYLASALIDGEVWLRPCFVNFRTTEDDVEAILDVARELGADLTSGSA